MNGRPIQFVPVSGAADFLLGATNERRFWVCIRNPNGSREEFPRQGGDAFEHAIAAIDVAGAGARISVRLIVGGSGA